MRQKIFDLTEQAPGLCKILPQCFINAIEKWLGFTEFNVGHSAVEDAWEAGSEENFFSLACKQLPLRYELEGLDNIPKEGPVVIVSNHPHGMSDGLMFGDVALKARSDVKIIVNEWLNYVRGMRPYTIQVDVYGGDKAKAANMRGMREAIKWLREGHCLLVFPSGSAATFSLRDARVIEDPWQENIAALARKTGATVVPMNISGRTSRFFQMVSMVAKGARSMFLPREIKRDVRTVHTIRLGKPITPTTMALLPDNTALSNYLRLASCMLRYPLVSTAVTSAPRDMQPIAEPESPELLQAELDKCEDDICYVNERAGLTVYALTAEKIPHLINEIGVQREITFRAVGEGSGLPRDLDAYDKHYVQLIMWDTKNKRLAGAYRIGRTDDIMREHGRKGIYNSLFFHLRHQFTNAVDNGLEMGRAFITAPYQRAAASLDTLWMGIGRYLNKHPEYRYLYGNVTVSQDYTPASRSLMLSYLRAHAMEPKLKKYVIAYEPPPALEIGLRSQDRRLVPTALCDLALMNTMVCALEPDGKGIPVLLRQYLRMGGKMVSFNVDPEFGNTLDCLVLVDLANAPERIMKRYRGL